MNKDMLEKKLADIEQTNLSEDLLREFTQLSTFIEASLGEAIKLDAGEKARSLTSSLIKMRDYMQTAVTQDGLRRLLLSEIQGAIDYVEPEVEETPPDPPKKSLNPGQEWESDRSMS